MKSPVLKSARNHEAPLTSQAEAERDIGARVSTNAGAILVGRGLAIGFSLAAGIVLARYLGSEKLGLFSSIYAYLALFNWLATFGFEPILIREISKERGSAGSLIHTTVVMSCFLCAGTFLTALLLAPLAGYNGPLRLLLMLAALEFIVIPIRIPGVIFQIDMRQWYGSLINVVRQTIWLGFVVFLSVEKLSLPYVILARLVCAVVEAALIWSYSERLVSTEKHYIRERARTLLIQAFPIAFTSFVATIYLRIDQVMLHKMASDVVLGHYSAAVKVSELFELFPAALMSSVAPVLAVIATRPAEFKKYIDTSFRAFMVLGAFLCVCMTLGADTIVRLFYGIQFIAAAPLLTILIWSEMAVFFATVVLNAMVARNLQKLLPWPTVVGAALNITLNIVLIPRYSAVGAAWATLISYTVAWMFFLLLFRSTRALVFQGLRYAIPTTAVALFSIGVVARVRMPISARSLVSVTVFLCGMFATRMISASDISEVHALFAQAWRRVS